MDVKKLVESLQNFANTLTTTDELMTISKVIEKIKIGSITSVQTVSDLPTLPLNFNGALYFIDSEGELVYNSDMNWYTLGVYGAYTWGYNSVGQLGDNLNTLSRTSPGLLFGGLIDKNWKQVSAGRSHNLAVTSSGIAYAWGYNSTGNIGDGTTLSRNAPVTVVGGITNWSQLSAGDTHSLGVTTTGIAYAWGDNTFGQLGDNNTGYNKSSPVTVVGGITNWKQLSAGIGVNYHSLGVTSAGVLYAWGRNDYGQLGTNNTTSRSSPVTVVGGITNWSQVSAGYDYSLGVTTTGIAYGWGNNAGYGVIGDGTTASKSSPVTVVGGITNWSQLSAGWDHSLGITSAGIAYAWGRNQSGQLGDGTTINRSSPVTVVGGITNWKQLSAGYNHSLGITSTGIAYGWGSNIYGSSGTRNSNLSSPVTVVGNITNWTQVSAGEYHSIGFTNNIKV